jgi:hypothetical protein
MTENKKKAQEARKKYDQENMALLATKLPKKDAEAFRMLADAKDSSVSRLLSDYVRGELAKGPVEPVVKEPLRGIEHIVSYENTDRLKHEVAFHNPGNLNPDEMLNEILDRYFTLVAEIRK